MIEIDHKKMIICQLALRRAEDAYFDWLDSQGLVNHFGAPFWCDEGVISMTYWDQVVDLFNARGYPVTIKDRALFLDLVEKQFKEMVSKLGRRNV